VADPESGEAACMGMSPGILGSEGPFPQPAARIAVTTAIRSQTLPFIATSVRIRSIRECHSQESTQARSRVLRAAAH